MEKSENGSQANNSHMKNECELIMKYRSNRNKKCHTAFFI